MNREELMNSGRTIGFKYKNPGHKWRKSKLKINLKIQKKSMAGIWLSISSSRIERVSLTFNLNFCCILYVSVCNRTFGVFLRFVFRLFCFG